MRARFLPLLLLLAVACGKTEPSKPTPTPMGSAAASANVTLHAYNVHLDPNAEEGSDAITFKVHRAGTPLHVVVTGPDVDICPVTSSAPCEHRKVADVDADGVRIRATGQAVDIEQIAIGYNASSRGVRLELPLLPPRPGESVCKDACNPVFEMTPFRSGQLTASATWEGIATGRLMVETGGMAEHDYTELGKPYKEISGSQASSDQGPPHMRISTTVPASEVAVLLENRGARPLLAPVIQAEWP